MMSDGKWKAVALPLEAKSDCVSSPNTMEPYIQGLNSAD